MKRTVPLLITAIGGFVLVVAFFIPIAEWLGEFAAICFDVLAAIAFILGGGNLLKIHLKKISDRAAGWGYSAVTIIAFFIMLYFGLFKTGTHPAKKQEFYGEVFVPFELSDIPDSQVVNIPGKIPPRGDGKKLPASVRQQLSEDDGKLVFRGWMLASQKKELIDYQDTLDWRCTVEKLFKASQPRTESLKGKIAYYADHRALSFKGYMTKDDKNKLLALGKDSDETWKTAVESLYEKSHKEFSILLDEVPKAVTVSRDPKETIYYDGTEKKLIVKGPMSTDQRDELAKQFPLAKPLFGERRQAFLKTLESKGNEQLTDKQRQAFNKTLDAGWSLALLTKTLDDAGKAEETDKDHCELLEEQKTKVAVLKPKKKSGKDVSLNDKQKAILQKFANDDKLSVKAAINLLKDAGEFTKGQESAFKKFQAKNPTVGERNKRICIALLETGSLSDDQRTFLLSDYQTEEGWSKTVNQLFMAAHTTKYPWSGEYNEIGAPFWWMYEYAFKPLTATMFAMLAFYVASAAFRAFRAKNLEANLLLGTAFIILLGRTFAGVVLTQGLPDSISGLKIENLTLYIMTIFNTAGSRAIMIGIALGVASTSLKVLLGVDRSYLGSSED
ncbi:MAG: hypothetical protein Tsb009_30520 [Planctomycetaceae bacterium]